MRPLVTNLWRHPDFLKLWVGETVSLVGSQVTVVALPLTAIYTLHATVFQLGILNGVAYLPALVVGLFIGVWVDHHRRLPLLIGTNIGRAVLLGAIPVAALLHTLSLGHLYIVAFLAGILSTAFGAAYRPYLPTLVRPDQLVEGNSKLEVSRSIAQISGPSLGGVVVGLLTAPLAIALDALSFVISALCMTTIRTPERAPARATQEGGVWQEVGEGVRLILGDPTLRAIAGSTGSGIFFSTLSLTVYVLYVTRGLGFSSVALGVLLALGGAGALVGATAATKITRRVGVGPTIIWAELGIGLSALLVPLAGRGTGTAALISFGLLALAQFFQGATIVVYDVNWISLLQTMVPAHAQGRVNATIGVLIFGLQPVGALLAGTLGTLIGLRPTLLVAAIGWSLVFLWPLCSPLRRLRTLPAGETEVMESAL